MARFTPASTPTRTITTTTTGASRRLATTILEPITSFWALCTKQAKKTSKKIASGSPKASMAKPKQLLATISHKATNFRLKKRTAVDDDDEDCDYGNGGLWQRSILMGDKCQPLDFSGVIYYDSNGKKLSELPMKSPRASPLPNYDYSKKQN